MEITAKEVATFLFGLFTNDVIKDLKEAQLFYPAEFWAEVEKEFSSLLKPAEAEKENN